MDTYKAVLDSENLGEPHSTLLGGDMWYPPDEQQVREVLARKELTGSGLMDGTRIGDDFLETLTVMQRATVEYYTFAGIERRSITVRTAAMGRDAVLVVSGGGIIELEPIPVDRMAQCLVEALPDAPAARVHSMACDETDLKGILNDKWLPSSNSVRDAKRMKRWLEAERINAGQLYAAVRDGSGSRNATSVPVPTWIDTEEGRILFSVDGNGWVNLVGAGPAAIADKLRALEQSLRN
ncbi:MAG: ESX secretion-associated protein EspG [Pseudonocardiaceae bacterium]